MEGWFASILQLTFFYFLMMCFYYGARTWSTEGVVVLPSGARENRAPSAKDPWNGVESGQG